MKKIILLAILAAVQFCSFGQNTMKFLGIPIDGSKEQMISALKNKGYTYDVRNDMLEGEFNGEDVIIFIKTNNNKVCAVGISDSKSVDEAQVKVRFNTLYYQFQNNGKYELISGNELSDEEDISYEMTVHKKEYKAYFAPIDKSINGMVIYKISEGLLGKYHITMVYVNYDNMANGEDL